MRTTRTPALVIAATATLVLAATLPTFGASPKNDVSTLAGKLAALNGTPGLQTRFSAFLQEEAQEDSASAPDPITPANVLTSPLDGISVAAPAVTVNQDTAAATQNETAIAVDPNNPNRVVAAANDYVPRTWACSISGTPCSALGDAYSGTYYSNDGGLTWCCTSTDPQHLGTLIPGVTRLAGGQYDAGGDPALAFDSQGRVFYAGLGFNRASAPNTVAVNRGTFNGGGQLSWSQPAFINQTTSPSTLNDKEWIAADWHGSSPFKDNVYVTWTRYIFNPSKGTYVQSPIFFSRSTNHGATFSAPVNIGANVLYSQGSRPVVGYDGTIYVFWDGSTRLASLDSIWMVKSTDGGGTWSKPVAVAPVVDIYPLANTVFRVNSFPAAAAAPGGDVYATWTSEVLNNATSYSASLTCAYFISGVASVRANCHTATVWSKSTNGGAGWTTPQLILPAVDASTQTAVGYPVTNPDGSTLSAPSAPNRVDSIWPGVAISPSGRVYMSTYAADVISPWQTCASEPPPPEGRINCTTLGNYVHNARLNYFVTNVGSGNSSTVSTHPINSRYQFGGGFIGDYTDLAVGSDNVYHALWTDTNNVQIVVWWYGLEFVPTAIHQQDVVTASGSIP